MQQHPGARLRALMEDGGVLAPFVWDAGLARFAEAAGHQAVYMTGFGTAFSHGLPDIGLLGLQEMGDNAARIAAAVEVPVIADADTGYGNASSVTHTVERYERAGVGAIHIEDQVAPKRCGFMDGKEVVALDEMLQKVRAAVRARQNDDLVFIARTDALAPLGWEAVVERCHAFRDEGADLVFIDGLKSKDDIERAAELLPDTPRLLNSGLLTLEEAVSLGYPMVIQLDTLTALIGGMQGVFEELRATGTVDLESRAAPTIDAIARTLGVDHYRAAEDAALRKS
jgi:2-methylisocitrate lyase-like PEP mutase family enzyme